MFISRYLLIQYKNIDNEGNILKTTFSAAMNIDPFIYDMEEKYNEKPINIKYIKNFRYNFNHKTEKVMNDLINNYIKTGKV